MPLNRGRPRTRPPVRRIAVEIDQELLSAVELVAGASPYRVIVEEALALWLERERVGSPIPDLNRRARDHQQLRQHAEQFPPTPSDRPRAR